MSICRVDADFVVMPSFLTSVVRRFPSKSSQTSGASSSEPSRCLDSRLSTTHNEHSFMATAHDFTKSAAVISLMRATFSFRTLL
jgi:hypothetical protein